MSDIVTRLRQTRANMIGTEDEQHYWDCHEAADAIERLRLTDAERAAADGVLEQTNHDAAPAAIACDGRPRTDKADLPTRAGAGDTPVTEPMPKEKRAEVSVRIDGPDPDSRVWETHTPQSQTTPGECSKPREGT